MAIDGTYGFVYSGVNGLGFGVFTTATIAAMGLTLETSVPIASPNRYFTGPSVEWQKAISLR